jgi:hypothetical protein
MAATLEEHTHRREDDGEDDLDNVTVRASQQLVLFQVLSFLRDGKQRIAASCTKPRRPIGSWSTRRSLGLGRLAARLAAGR